MPTPFVLPSDVPLKQLQFYRTIVERLDVLQGSTGARAVTADDLAGTGLVKDANGKLSAAASSSSADSGGTLDPSGFEEYASYSQAGADHELLLYDWKERDFRRMDWSFLSGQIAAAAAAAAAANTAASSKLSDAPSNGSTYGRKDGAWSAVTGPPANCVAWVAFDGTGTVTINGYYNVTSITDGGTGTYTVNFTNTLSSANYCIAGSAMLSGAANIIGWSGGTGQTFTTSSHKGFCRTASGAADADHVNVAFFL